MKKWMTCRTGSAVFLLILMTVLCLESGYCTNSIRRFEEAQARQADADARMAAVCTDGLQRSRRVAEKTRDAIEAIREVSLRWDDIFEYTPVQTLHLAGYQLRYLANRTPVLDFEAGIIQGPSGNETYYNLDMSWVVSRLEAAGIEGEYYVREDGVKMYGDYIMVAGDFSLRPFGTIVQTSLGEGIVCDTGMFIYFDPYHIDIAASW